VAAAAAAAAAAAEGIAASPAAAAAADGDVLFLGLDRSTGLWWVVPLPAQISTQDYPVHVWAWSCAETATVQTNRSTISCTPENKCVHAGLMLAVAAAIAAINNITFPQGV
jgi:hypothetical protein